jgi:hypothetical protein
MTKQTDHRLIRSYLRQFDAVAAVLPRPRRALLREEIVTHLRDAVSPGMSDGEVAAVVLALGSPAEIIGEETGSASRREVFSVAKTGWAKFLFVALAIVAAAMVLTVMLPFLVSYLTAPGPYFSAFAWALGAALAAASVAFFVAARRHSRH